MGEVNQIVIDKYAKQVKSEGRDLKSELTTQKEQKKANHLSWGASHVLKVNRSKLSLWPALDGHQAYSQAWAWNMPLAI